MISRLMAVLVGVLLLSSAFAGAAAAGLGVAIDLGRLRVAEPLRPGAVLELPVLTVRNAGDQPGEYSMAVAPIEGGGEVADEWVRFDPPAFALAPGERQPVQATLTVPAGTRPGSYEFLLRAGVRVDPAAGEVAGVSAGAASRVTLTVADPSVLRALWRFGKRLVTDLLPWTLGLGAVAVLLLLAPRFRVQVVRR